MRRVICDVMVIVTTVTITPDRHSAITKAYPPTAAATDEQDKPAAHTAAADASLSDPQSLDAEMLYIHCQQIITVYTLSLDNQALHQPEYHQPNQPAEFEQSQQPSQMDDNGPEEW